jgi:CPA2 family monovalent cation:H+ antiporter-2
MVFGLSLSVARPWCCCAPCRSRGILETGRGRIAVGWLIVEDLAMVLVLVLLPPLSG